MFHSRDDFAGRAYRWPGFKTAAGAPALHFVFGFVSFIALSASAADSEPAAKAINEFGLNFYRELAAGDGNLCLSPYSVGCALTMAASGADGETRIEMARVLRLEPNADADFSIAALQKSIEETSERTAKLAANAKEHGGPTEPITIVIANRLFPQSGYDFRQDFFARLKQNYGAEPEPLDYRKDAAAATKRINEWVTKETRDRIRDLIPQTLSPDTRLVLANAIYLKAPWASDFRESATTPEPFHIKGGAPADVQTMRGLKYLGHVKKQGYAIVTIPYSDGELQFIVFVPDDVRGLASIEQKLDAATLAECTKLQSVEVDLHLPKFKFEPPTVPLSGALKSLGMHSAFDIPPGSAIFSRMAARKPKDYLAISEVFHKTFIAVDEKGTEAAAATAVAMNATSSRATEKPLPIEVKVDRPFLYAIQHVPSGACLFIGRVTDPR